MKTVVNLSLWIGTLTRPGTAARGRAERAAGRGTGGAARLPAALPVRPVSTAPQRLRTLPPPCGPAQVDSEKRSTSSVRPATTITSPLFNTVSWVA